MSDEGVHEIQLNGKQLVFMFMAVTVVAVVIFLCGVMVGRGVRTPRAADQADTATESNVDPTAAIQPSPSPSAPISSDPSPSTTPAPVPAQEKLTYADRLGTTTQPPETLKEPVTPASAVSQPAPEPAPVAPAVRAAKASPNERATKSSTNERATTSSSSTNEPSGGGYVVQVAAVKARDEADTIARKLASKGFPSFVTTPGPGAARVFRVRVGKYTDRREAESVARRLEKEEQFKPWITR